MGTKMDVTRGKKEQLEALFRKHGYTDFKWIEPEKIIVSQWVRMKCMYGCGGYGQVATCPPNLPSVSECERFFREYSDVVIFHFAKKVAKPEDRHGLRDGQKARLSNSGSFGLFPDDEPLCLLDD